jgi:hypothetical protein
MPAVPVLRIGNVCGFWGDAPDAPLRLATQAPDLDVLTLDYLAEVSMSILARQRARHPELGYPRDFLDVIRSLAPLWSGGRRLKLVTNAGGLNPRGCASAVAAILREAGCKLRIAIVSGDDVLAQLCNRRESFQNLETAAALAKLADRLVSANAYLGAAPIVEALQGHADIVITGRLADPSLTVAPAAAHFGWNMSSDFDRIAGATIAGHLIECGQQVTGGISTDWLSLPDAADIGYPIAEIAADGSCVITKPPGTGGRVDQHAVKEQLLYEIGDPARYLSPDATVSFLTLGLSDDGPDRVRITSATGSAPPDSYKVSATYPAGWRAAATLTIIGRNAVAKAQRCGQVVRDRLRRQFSREPQEFIAECLGSGDAARGVLGQRDDLTEVVLRLGARDNDKSMIEYLARQIAPLVTSGPQGTTGYFDSRPEVREVFAYWPTLIERDWVKPLVEFLEV